MNPVNEMLRWRELASCEEKCAPPPPPVFPEADILIPLPVAPAPAPAPTQEEQKKPVVISIPSPTPRPPDDLNRYNRYLGIVRPPPLVEGFTTQSYEELETMYQEMMSGVDQIRTQNLELQAKIAREESVQQTITKKESIQSSFEELYKVAIQRNESYQKIFMTVFSIAIFLIVITVVFYQFFYPRS
jgi:hypothetical protein